MKYHLLKPEVPGEVGNQTIYDKTQVPWTLLELHVVIQGWIGGDILKVSNAYLVTPRLKNAIIKSNLSGIEGFKKVQISLGDHFTNLYPNRSFPEVEWLLVNGKEFKDDFWYIDYSRIVISEKAKQFLADFDLSNSRFVKFGEE